ncbi:hypothetical protein [Eubacterium sp.]|uniref:hypothetical protein n=1 Tax=Eubacterium sp. TaxID=142586 RepID=UPI002FCA885A
MEDLYTIGEITCIKAIDHENKKVSKSDEAIKKVISYMGDEKYMSTLVRVLGTTNGTVYYDGKYCWSQKEYQMLKDGAVGLKLEFINHALEALGK